MLYACGVDAEKGVGMAMQAMPIERAGHARGMWRRPGAVVLGVGLALGACAGPEPRYALQPLPAPTAVPSATVYFYPLHGQSAAQQDRDRYECYRWAVQQTGYDPGDVPPPAGQRVEVVPTVPPGHDTAVGAVTGAAIGAAVSRPRHAAGGAVVGAIAGAIVGAASDTARQQRTEQMQRVYDERAAAEAAALARTVNDYRRAMGACLEGRGYTVR